VRLQAPSFPILTFDETSLTPSLGYLFNNKWLYPCESLISILWKFERANALTGIVVARLLGPEIDPYEGVVPDRGSLDLHRLRDEFGLPRETLRRAAPSSRGVAALVACSGTVDGVWATTTMALCINLKI
jgi:hypothetical protein